MTFYQELQLSSAGSKDYISKFIKPKEKLLHILIFIFKVVINLIFCMAVIMGLSMIFGTENSIAGLVVLLGILTFRFSDFDIRASHSVGAMFLIFFIFAVGPKAANLVPYGCNFCINCVCLLFIVILGCHNARLFNHAVLVLSYILLYGSDVSGFSYVKRLLCLILGAVVTSLILYRNQRKRNFDYAFKDLFKDFSLSNERSRWQIKIALCVSGAILLAELLEFTKPVWAGIAAMSVTVPVGDVKTRVESRVRANVMGTLLFLCLYFILPSSFITYFSIIGGLSTGFAARYEGQTTWNSLSAMSVAVLSINVKDTVIFRVLNNITGALFAFLFGLIIEQVLLSINGQIQKFKQKKTITEI